VRYQSIRVATAKLCLLWGIPHNRHAFAVNNLRSWLACGENVGALLPVLQTYLGHSSIADTAYYLRLTAESYPHISAQAQRVIGDVVPPITAGPHHGH
jgi:integrase/recombinase XerD